MVIRGTAPFSFGFEPGRKPSNLTVAVGVSIGVHVAIGLYVAMLKFTGPPPLEYPPERIFDIPLIDELKPPPPPPERQVQKQSQPQRPVIHDPVPTDVPPIPPLEVAKSDLITPPSGPVGGLGPTIADPPARVDPIIRNPSWVKRPDAGDFARFYPDRAMRMERQGEAEITCAVAASGKLTDCRITGETPKNFGFGEAALKLSRYLQIAPKTIDGRPVDGGILIVPISFRLPA